MTEFRLKPLAPELIGGLFGRPRTLSNWLLHKVPVPRRFLWIGVLLGAALLALAAGQGVAWDDPDVPSTLFLVTHPDPRAQRVQLSLIGDPVALIAFLVAMATPFLCHRQVTAIAGFVGMNERNVGFRSDELRVVAINTLVKRANAWLASIGSRTASAAFLLFSGIGSYGLYLLLRREGLYQGWNPTGLSDDDWRHRVYDAWWANFENHLSLAVALWCVGTYLFYFVSKQVAMGVVFAFFAGSALRYEFGVAPNLLHNTDGYWGLRILRRFMQWTYGSALAHLVVTLGVFVVWLPFGQRTFLVVSAVMLANVVVVLYPSSIALRSSIREKDRYVAYLITANGPSAETESTIARVWDTPNLPFRVRSTLSALTFYLLVPLALAVVSAVFGAR